MLDGKVLSAPVINSRITDAGVIEGHFTQKEVRTWSRCCARARCRRRSPTSRSAPSARRSARTRSTAGTQAALLGGALVVLLMLVVYKLAGVNALVALARQLAASLFGALAYFGATLTLPGIAGIVLSIGMAVDANVLIFERIKEEIKAGRTVKAAIDAGFGKAWTAVIDTNVTTLIAALFLFQFGTGPIRGFAVTLVGRHPRHAVHRGLHQPLAVRPHPVRAGAPSELSI